MIITYEDSALMIAVPEFIQIMDHIRHYIRIFHKDANIRGPEFRNKHHPSSGEIDPQVEFDGCRSPGRSKCCRGGREMIHEECDKFQVSAQKAVLKKL
jgi:hypothetical protein